MWTNIAVIRFCFIDTISTVRTIYNKPANYNIWMADIEGRADAAEFQHDQITALVEKSFLKPRLGGFWESLFAGAPTSYQLPLFHGSVFTNISARWISTHLPTDQIEKINELAKEVFEDEAAAKEWLLEPNLATDNKPPIDLLGSPDGYARVFTLLKRIEYGNLA